MSGEHPPSGPQPGAADDLLCVAALRVIATERGVRTSRRHEAAPTQAGFLVGQLVEGRPGDASLAEAFDPEPEALAAMLDDLELGAS